MKVGIQTSKDDEKKKIESSIVKTNKKLVYEIIDLLLGIAMGLYGIITYSNDINKWYGYTYRAPFSEHEIIVLLCIVAGLLSLIISPMLINSNIKELTQLKLRLNDLSKEKRNDEGM